MRRMGMFPIGFSRWGVLVAKVEHGEYAHVHFYEWPPRGKEGHEGICFVPADLASVSVVREYMENKADAWDLTEEECYEISLICDELLSNAIIATYNRGISEHVVLRYKFGRDHIIISVLDYGGGFDLNQVERELPDGENLSEFMESLKKYRGELIRKVKIHGREVEHPRFGRGLRIVSGLADFMIVLFHNDEGKFSQKLESSTVGTLISVRYLFKSKLDST
ncbi:MAG: ATP-binding protein [Leptospiraceae bacterium]|nr:ATP-binding protein [Leptospiraceae bacterium]MDW8307443.1 ATP-binding protein [Leptospiraceae bacterium]